MGKKQIIVFPLFGTGTGITKKLSSNLGREQEFTKKFPAIQDRNKKYQKIFPAVQEHKLKGFPLENIWEQGFPLMPHF